jgi:hypothetical protein
MRLAQDAPTGIQVYADLWREDLCLDAAEIIEHGAGMSVPMPPENRAMEAQKSMHEV